MSIARNIRFCCLFTWALLLGACQSAVVSVGAIDIPAPVLVGPVAFLDDKDTLPTPPGQRFAGGAVAVEAEPQRRPSGEKAAADFFERMASRDDLPQKLAQALAGNSDQAFYAERIRVVDAVHWSALFLIDKRLTVEGYMFPLGKKNRVRGEP